MKPVVMKFGGTSLGTAERIRQAVDLVAASRLSRPTLCVVSAMCGVTSDLERWVAAAVQGTLADAPLDGLLARHLDALRELAPGEIEVESALGGLVDRLRGWLASIAHARSCTPALKDDVMALGERLSAPLVAAALRAAGTRAEVWDGRDIIRTDSTAGEATVDDGITSELVRSRFRSEAPVPVVTGFIGSDADGRTTLLGRGGSDYSAALVGAALDAERVEIWTDVDGVMSADPKVVPDARTLPQLTYEQAAELARLGGKVLHPRTMRPLAVRGVPLFVRNTLSLEAPGTRIGLDHYESREARAVTTAGPLIEVQLAEREPAAASAPLATTVLEWLGRRGEPVLLASPLDHGGTLTIGAEAGRVDAWLPALEASLREGGRKVAVQSRGDRALVAAVGAGANEPRTLARVLGRLADAGIDSACIAVNRLGVTATIAECDRPRAARVAHRSLLAPRHVCLVLAGATGQVGGALATALANRREGPVPGTTPLDIHGVASSRAMRWSNSPLDPAVLADALTAGESLDWNALRAEVLASRCGPTVLVDCTASDEVAGTYAAWLSGGVSVVTPNKRACAGPWPAYQRLRTLAETVPFEYETTVGAALPVLSTIRDLVRAGDQLRSVAGVLSGTLAFVLDRVNCGQPFSRAVRDAAALGYTEPHPADDLSGEDVARKLLILLREAGLCLERADLVVESLVPPELVDQRDPARFLARLEAYDASWPPRVEAARRTGGRLVYQATFDGSRATVGLATVTGDSPLARLRAGENVLVFHTDRYDAVPLTIAGPGAGPAVTAAGVLADIERAARMLVGGAR